MCWRRMFYFSDYGQWETNLKSIPFKMVQSWKYCSSWKHCSSRKGLLTLFSPRPWNLYMEAACLSRRSSIPVYAILKLRSPKKAPCFITVWSYKHLTPRHSRSSLTWLRTQIVSCLFFSENDVNSRLKIFNDTFHSVLDVHAPIRIVKICSRSCPYVTHGIIDLMRDGDDFTAVSYKLVTI